MQTHQILRLGHSRLVTAGNTKEAAKRGTLRGGTVGTWNQSAGISLGKCARIALARMLGFQAPTEGNRHLMFEGGFSNEDNWMAVLSAGWDGPILREEEIPVVWQTSNGTPVTGRPDIVLCQTEVRQQTAAEVAEINALVGPDRTVEGLPVSSTVPVRGLELKSVMSVGTAIDVLVREEPKTEHVIQAAHYAWKLGLPWEIWYTSRCDWPILGWVIKEFARWSGTDIVFGEPIVQYRDSGAPQKILPFYKGFQIEIDKATGFVYYRVAGGQSDSDWRQTLITTDDIEAYYEQVSQMPATKDLGPRPSNLTMHGEYQGFNKCDAKYCPFSQICDRHEGNYDAWVDAVEEECRVK